ncbi:hypothetical protein PpBr36_08754 [Pyricularia pennisetigena]|uniref:hypothetical protein n=1 Tax=Pyricularia pennisetigena TaxID=1578925 RepID=UPI001154CF92|nr:hypothetical protein PpBr36_08754 [Pyricularia pennisetigena]TLS24510.1 hypothetical protein PpBr36_08754 [Pyricularia pennisetigena]
MADVNPPPTEYFDKELEPRAVSNGGLVSHYPSERFTQATGSIALATRSGYISDEPLENSSSSGESTYLGSPADSIHPSKENIEERSTATVPERNTFDDASQVNGAPLDRLDSCVHHPVILPSAGDAAFVDGSRPQSRDCSASASLEDSEEEAFAENAWRLARDSIRHPLDIADSRYQPSPLPNAPSDTLTKPEESAETPVRKPSVGSFHSIVNHNHPEPAQNETSELSNEDDEVWTWQVSDPERVNGLATQTVFFKTRAGNPVKIVNQSKQPFVSCRGLRVVNPDTTPNEGADYESSDDPQGKPSSNSRFSGSLKLNGHVGKVETEKSFGKSHTHLNGKSSVPPTPVSFPGKFASASSSRIYKPTNTHLSSEGNGSASQPYSQTTPSLVSDISSDSDGSSSNDSLGAPVVAVISSASQANPAEKDTKQNLGIKTASLENQVEGTLDQLRTARWSLGLLWRTFFELLRMTFSLTLRITASTARGVGAIFQFDLRAFSSLLKIWLQFSQVVIHTFLASTLIVTIAVGLSLLRTRFFAACKETFSRAIEAWDSAVPKFLSLRYYGASALSAWLSTQFSMPAPPQQDFHGAPMVEHSHPWTRSEPESDHRSSNIRWFFGKPKSQQVSFQDTSLKPTYLRVTTTPDIPSATQRLHQSDCSPRKHTGEKASKPREVLRSRGVKPTGRLAQGRMKISQGIGSKSASY